MLARLRQWSEARRDAKEEAALVRQVDRDIRLHEPRFSVSHADGAFYRLAEQDDQSEDAVRAATRAVAKSAASSSTASKGSAGLNKRPSGFYKIRPGVFGDIAGHSLVFLPDVDHSTLVEAWRRQDRTRTLSRSSPQALIVNNTLPAAGSSNTKRPRADVVMFVNPGATRQYRSGASASSLLS